MDLRIHTNNVICHTYVRMLLASEHIVSLCGKLTLSSLGKKIPFRNNSQSIYELNSIANR